MELVGFICWGIRKLFSFCEKSTTFSTSTNMEEFSHTVGLVFTPEPIVPRFYERNFPLTWKAFRDARWKLATREPSMEVGQVAEFQANICKLWLQDKGTLTPEH